MSDNTTDTTTTNPALTEMGIIRFNEISHYSLRQDGADKDILRIIYNRKKGSLLPYSRKYKFGRAQKTVVADGGSSRMEHRYEISPFLLTAVNELDELVKVNQHDISKSPNTELKSDLVTEIDDLKQLINNSAASGDMTAVLSKIESVRKHIDAL